MFFNALNNKYSTSSSDGDKHKDNNSKDKSIINGNFDPSALERGAKALRELDASPNAQKAFEIIKLQEKTRQKELEKEIEQSSAYRSKANIERVRVEAEERRKTLSHQQEEERITAQYKAKLEAEAYHKKLKEQEIQNSKILKQQQEKFLEQEEIRKRNEREILQMRKKQFEEEKKIEQENIKVKVREETLGKIKLERENADIHLNELRVRAIENRKTHLDSIKTIFDSISNIGNSFYQDKSKIKLLVGTITALTLGIYGAKNGTNIIAKTIESKIGKPSLIRETNLTIFSKYNLIPKINIIPPILVNYFRLRNINKSRLFEDIVLSEQLEQRLNWTVNSLVNSKRFGLPFKNMLLWGKPGTGKTMFARKLAKESGLHYAIMSGGDIGPLGKDGVSELNRVFDWAKRSRKGLILFIDEAEAFLFKGRENLNSKMSEETRNSLSTFLHQTGTESKDICVLLATNTPNSLDKAILDRIDESFEFSNPDYKNRIRLIEMFLNLHFIQPRTSKKKFGIGIHPSFDRSFIEYLASKTEGFSGRQLSKLIISMKSIVLGTGVETLTKDIGETALAWKLKYFDKSSEDFVFNSKSGKSLQVT